MEMKHTEALVDFVREIKWEDLSPGVIETSKLFLLDFVASALAGYKVNRVFNEAVKNVLFKMGGTKESSVMFYGEKLPAVHTAFLNGVLGHGADMDDGHRTAQGHPGVAIIPAALALGEASHQTGRDVILSIIVGYDIFVRLARAVNPSHFSRGFHTTGTVGTIAAAVTAAKILDIGREQVRHTISLAALQSAGLLEVAASGQMAKPLHPGKAAANGCLAALLAREGAEGPETPLEGEKGFFRAFTDKTDPGLVTAGLGRQFEITGCYFKLYPACRHVHGAVDAAVKLHKTGLLKDPEQIEKIRVSIYPAALKLTGSIYYPNSEEEAKFSLPYSVAVGLLRGGFTLDDLKTGIALDRAVRCLIEKTEILSDPELERRDLNRRGAKVEIILKNGSRAVEAVELPKGDPEVPVTKEDIENKLRACGEGIVSAKQQEEIIRLIDNLDRQEDIKELCALWEKI